MRNLIKNTQKNIQLLNGNSNIINRYYFSSLNDNQMKQFNKLKGWWSPAGPNTLLYQYNYFRIQFLKKNLQKSILNPIKPLQNMKVLDVGCGAGFLSQSLTRLGANVVAIDPSLTSFNQAKNHSNGDQTLNNLQYRNITLQELLQNQQNHESFDIVTSMEVIEHVNNPQSFALNLSKSLKNGGLLMLSTIARNQYSYLTHIIAAQHLLRIVPKGTHHHKKFINPDQLNKIIKEASIQKIDLLQLQVNWKGQFQRKTGGSNYLMMGKKNKNNQKTQQSNN